MLAPPRRPTKSNVLRVAGIDVGYSHLACVICDVDTEDVRDVTAVHARMQDLRKLKCREGDQCMFEHTDRKGAHLVHHYVETMHVWFSTVDQVVIEAQPICSSHKDIEQLLHLYLKQRFGKDKGPDFVKLIAPRSMHAHFRMSNQKVERRVQVVEITQEYLAMLPAFQDASQKDHLGDAMAYVLFFAQVTLPARALKEGPNPFAKFAFVGVGV